MAIGSSVCTAGAWCLVGPAVVLQLGIWLFHERLQNSPGQVTVPQKKSRGLLLVRSQASNGLELLSFMRQVSTEFPCVLFILAPSWTSCSLTQPDQASRCSVVYQEEQSLGWGRLEYRHATGPFIGSPLCSPSCLQRYLVPLVSEVFWGPLRYTSLFLIGVSPAGRRGSAVPLCKVRYLSAFHPP